MIRLTPARFSAAGFIFLLGLGTLRAAEPVPPPVVRSYADTRPVNVADELAAVRASGEALTGSVALKPLTFAAAQAKIDALANSAGGESAVSAVGAAVGLTDPERLRAVAAREMIQGRPTGMFLVLWLGWKHFPADGDAWCDLAGTLAGLGYANEAAALLAEMKTRGLLPAPPVGIPGEEMRDYVEAYTQVRLGNTGEALTILRRIAGRTPFFAEAPRLLAAITDDESEARKALLQSIWRKPMKIAVSSPIPEGEAEPDPYQAGDEVMADPREIMDFSQAERGVLPSVPYVKSIPKAIEMEAKLDQLYAAVGAEASAVSAARKTPKGYTHTETDVLETWGHRMYGLLQSIDYRDARLRELYARARTADQERVKALGRLTDERAKEVDAAMEPWLRSRIKNPPTLAEIGSFQRPYWESYMGKARAYCEREESAKREWFAEWHYLATAIASTVPPGPWHDAMEATIQVEKLHNYERIIHVARMYADFCINPLVTKEPEEETGTMPGRTQAGKCDDSKSVGFSTTELPGGKALPFELGFEMNCEGASVEFGVDTRIPGVSFSTEIGADNKGEYTVFVGPKAQIGTGSGIVDFNVSGKVGAYVTGNKNGMTDAGFKAEAKAGGGIGNISAAQKLGEAKWSFVPTVPPGMNSDLEPLAHQAR